MLLLLAPGPASASRFLRWTNPTAARGSDVATLAETLTSTSGLGRFEAVPEGKHAATSDASSALFNTTSCNTVREIFRSLSGNAPAFVITLENKRDDTIQAFRAGTGGCLDFELYLAPRLTQHADLVAKTLKVNESLAKRKGVAGHVGCWDSHQRVALEALRRGMPRALIFEDDVGFTSSFLRSQSDHDLSALRQQAALLSEGGPSGLDLLYLGCDPIAGKAATSNKIVGKPDICLVQGMGTHAYAASASMLREMVDLGQYPLRKLATAHFPEWWSEVDGVDDLSDTFPNFGIDDALSEKCASRRCGRMLPATVEVRRNQNISQTTGKASKLRYNLDPRDRDSVQSMTRMVESQLPGSKSIAGPEMEEHLAALWKKGEPVNGDLVAAMLCPGVDNSRGSRVEKGSRQKTVEEEGK